MRSGHLLFSVYRSCHCYASLSTRVSSLSWLASSPRNFFERIARRNRGAIATKGSINDYCWLYKNKCYFYYKRTTKLVARSLRRLPKAAAPWFAPLGKPRLRKLRLRFAPLRMTRKTFVPPYFYSMYLGGVFGVVVPKNLRELMLKTAQKSQKLRFDNSL